MTLSPFRRLTDDRLESPQNADVPMTFKLLPIDTAVSDVQSWHAQSSIDSTENVIDRYFNDLQPLKVFLYIFYCI